jgi:hypothetical protein
MKSRNFSNYLTIQEGSVAQNIAYYGPMDIWEFKHWVLCFSLDRKYFYEMYNAWIKLSK